jgi:hypothetical protein
MWQKPSCSPASSLSFRTVSFIFVLRTSFTRTTP